ncbi:uncharacterized protein [Argopecten irradians]|uniref:uncharacterized protein n=1 Tax=Argopecten irradians TaxID=31199 RepID=UPI0037134125
MVGPHSSSGVKVVLHKDTEVPMPEYGNELPTGRHGFMDVQVSKAQNVPLPHGSCVNKVLTYLDMYSYTVGACQMECEMQYVSAMCLCRPIHMPQGLSSLPSCNVVQYSKCLKEAKVKYRRYRDVKCSCPVPCSQTWFRPDLSYGALSRFSANQRRVLENLNLKSRLKNSRELAFREERDYVDLQHLYTHLNATSLPNFYRVLNDLESVDAMLNMSSNIIIHFYWHILYTRSYFDKSHKVYERYHDYSILLDKARLGFDLVEVTTLLDSQIRLMFLTDRPDKWRAYYEMMLSKTKTDLEAIRAVINSDFLTWFPNQYPNIWFDEDEVKTQRMPAVSTIAPDLQWTAIQNTIEESKKTINRYLSLAKSHMETGRMDKARLQTLNSTSIELAFDFIVQRSNMHAFYKDSVIGNLNHLSRVLTDRSEPITSVLSTFDKKCTTMYITKGIRKASSYLNMTVEYLSQYFNQERILQTIVHQFDSNEMKYFIEEVRTFASGTFHNKEFSMESEDCVLMLLDEYYKMLNVYIKIEPALAGLKHKFDHRYFNRIMPTPTQLQNFKFEKTEFLELVLVLDDIVKMMGDFKESLRMNQQFYRDNFLHLNVLFHELRYDELTQQIDYTIFALMGDIGGAMGLCIGASALSVFEIIDFLTVLVGTAMVKTNSNPRPKVVHVKPLNDSKVMTRDISKQEQISCTKELWMMERAKTFC